MKKILLFVLFIGFQGAQASVIAVIDSGTDLTHSSLSKNQWTNAKDVDDAVDNDDNGYIDDIHGWNFADSNNKLVDRKYLGSFSADCYKFFEVQTRMLRGEANDVDREWMQEARKNEKLMHELGTFGNFIHGTHVAGIAAKSAERTQIMVLKIIPTKSPIGRKAKALFSGVEEKNADSTEVLLKKALALLASQQGKGLQAFGEYVGKQNARVANCSFGTSTQVAKMILQPILKLALKREPTDAELLDYSKFFVGEVVKAGKSLVSPAPKTLFVIAAGNDGTSNDLLPTSPANVKMQNTISVAATFGYSKLAAFSNYGEQMVEVAAPGVGIYSAIPGEKFLTVSGTSQASPFVANAAGLMLDANENLSNAEVKRILIETSDLKDFMKGKVASKGIVNTKRAMAAAQFALKMNLDEAIAQSRNQVNDVSDGLQIDFLNQSHEEEAFVLPLPSLFL